MLQRTRADQVVPIFTSFTSRFPTIRSLSLEEEELDTMLSPLGLNWRIKKLKELLSEILKLKTVPKDYEELLALPGVGDYAASALLSFHLDTRRPLIDSNTVRLYGRFFGFSTDTETRRKRWFIDFVEKITPVQCFADYNYAVLDFSRSICKKGPLCTECIININCNYYNRLHNES
jgi:A/G-specific adenine glycosylase